MILVNSSSLSVGSGRHVPSQLAMAERANDGEKGAKIADEADPTFECRECGKTLSTSRGYWAHVNKHAGKRPFKCTLCPKSYSGSKSLSVHIRRTHKLSQKAKNPLTKSKSITLSSSGTTSLEKARRRTEVLRKFQCSLCGQILKSLVSYKEHCKKHATSLQADRSFKPRKNKSTSNGTIDRHKAPGLTCSTVDTVEPQRKCCYCFKVFKNAAYARRHEKHSHGPCSKCGRALSCNNSLKAHLNLHDGRRPYKCSNCPKTFYSSKSLSEHEKSIHWVIKMVTKGSKGNHLAATHSLNTQVPDVSASKARKAKGKGEMKNGLCGKASASVRSRKVHPICHVKASHKFKCSYCSRDYFSVKSLNAHLKAKHSLPKVETAREKSAIATNSHPFQKTSQETEDTVRKKQNVKCTCGDINLNQQDYEASINVRADDQPYSCPRCQYAPCSSRTLKRRIEQKHKSKRRRFLCTYCGRVLSDAQNYEMHCNKHASITPYKCSQCFRSFHGIKGLNSHRKKCSAEKTKKQIQNCAPKCQSTKQQNIQEGMKQQNLGGKEKRREEEWKEEEECGKEGEQGMEGEESLGGDEGGQLSSVTDKKVAQKPRYPVHTDWSLTTLSVVDESASREKLVIAANSHPLQKTSQETEDTVRKKQNVKCTCGDINLNQQDYEASINVRADDQPYSCPRCQYAPCSSRTLKRRIEQKHQSKRRRFLCKYCGHVLSNIHNYEMHCNRHAGITPYKCSQCSRSFHGIKGLYYHRKICKAEKMKKQRQNCAPKCQSSKQHNIQEGMKQQNLEGKEKSREEEWKEEEECGKEGEQGMEEELRGEESLGGDEGGQLSSVGDEKVAQKPRYPLHTDWSLTTLSVVDESASREKSVIAANSHPFQKTSPETEDIGRKKQNVKCTCGDINLNQQDYEAGINIRAGDQPHSCPRCQYAPCSSRMLKRRIDEKHQSKRQKFICTYCGRVLSDAKNYEMHCNKHAGITPYKCSQCFRSFHGIKELNAHRKKCSAEKTKKQIQNCAPKCQSTKQQNIQEGTKQQKGEQGMEGELRGEESLGGGEVGQLSFVGDEKVAQKPRYPLRTDRSLTTLSVVDKYASFRCGLCEMMLATYTLYMAHMTIHGEKSCIQNQTSPSGPSNSTQNPENMPYTQNPICNSGSREQPFKCTMCVKAYAKSKTLTRHMKLKHPTQPVPSSLERRDMNRNEKMLHMPEVEKKPLYNLKFHCGKCYKAYDIKSSLQSHYWQKHLHRMPKTHNKISKEPQEAHGRKSRANQLHSSQLLPFLCQCCSRAYAHRHSLLKHMRIKHFQPPASQEKMKTRSYQLSLTKECNNTQAKDSEKSQVGSDREPKSEGGEPQVRDDEEMQTQKAIKPQVQTPSFPCLKCPKVFAYKGMLLKHIRFCHYVAPPLSHWTRRCSQLYQAEALPNQSSAEQLPSLCSTPEDNVSPNPPDTDHPGTFSSDVSSLTLVQHNTQDHELSHSISPSLPHKSSHLRSRKSQLKQNQLICPFCDKQFCLVPHFCWHVFAHRQLQPFACSVCHKQYSSVACLRRHQNTHRGDKIICCSLCWKFQSTSNHHILTHLLNTHGQQLQQEGLSLPHCLAESEEQPTGSTQPHREELCAVSERAEPSPVCGVGAQSSSVCGVGEDISSLCGVEMEHSSVCDVAAESSSLCGVKADSSSLCGVGVETSCMYEVVEMGSAGEDVGNKPALTFASCGGGEGECEVWGGEEVQVCGEVQIGECPSPAEASPAPPQADTVVVKYGNWDVFFFKNSSSK